MLSLFSALLMFLFGSGLLHLMYPGTEKAAMDACETHMRIVSLSFPANAVCNAGAALYRIMGRTAVTKKVSLAANGINVLGNAVGSFVLRAGAVDEPGGHRHCPGHGAGLVHQGCPDLRHASPMMAVIAALREKYDLHMTAERYVSADVPESGDRFIRK